MKKLIIQGNYLLLWVDANLTDPTAVYSKKNTTFEFNSENGNLEIKESGSGKFTFSAADVLAGNVVGEWNIAFSKESLFTFLTENTGNFKAAPGGSGEEMIVNKDASNGYVGLTLFKINFKNVLGTVLSFFTNSNTAERTYTFQDRNGTIADNTDLATKENNLPTMVGQSLKVLRVNAGETAKEWATISTGGICGISNASGIYTYYATLTLAMAAAVSGQTIEIFANITETAAVVITLKTGVNIQGNGYTYTLNVAGVSNAMITAASVTYTANILNLNVIRTGSTSDIGDGGCLNFGGSNILDVDLSGSKFTNNGSGVSVLINATCTGQINNGFARSKSIYGAYFCGSSVDIMSFNSCIGIGYSGGSGFRLHNGGTANNCVGISDSGIGFYSTGNSNNCSGISVSGIGFFHVGGSALNCSGKSISNTGFDVTNGVNTLNCSGVSASGIGMSTNMPISNCSGVSGSNLGIRLTAIATAIAYNCFSKSSTNASAIGFNLSKFYGCTLFSQWNNAAGYGITGNGGLISNFIINCNIILANATAPYLFNGGIAAVISMRGNTYQGGAAFNANLTQAITAVEDAQGNIYL